MSVAAGRDIRDSTINIGHDPEKLVAVLEARGLLQPAELAGLQRQTVVALAQRLKPEEKLDFGQAVAELKRAVEVALEVIARGERGTNHEVFVNEVLARVAGKTKDGDFDGSVHALDDALAELDRRADEQRDLERRSRIALLTAAVQQETLRRDAASVARRIEAIVTAEHPGDRPTWLPAFREHYDEYEREGRDKGINFSLSVAIELARRIVTTARDTDERGIALDLLGTALGMLGEREVSTGRLKAAIAAFYAALQERTRDRDPAGWATT
ncbi:MAG: hypothetical protein WCC64_21820, partial [Aliidongia sp.]